METEGNKGPARIPRESLHGQDERLTNKHIQTLGFLQEIANENKELKARVDDLEKELSECEDLHQFAKDSKAKIKDIQESYLARADEINHMLSEKHRIELMQIQEERLDMEREMKEQMLRMRHEIESLRAANQDLRETATEEEENDEIKKKLKQTDINLQEAMVENEELRQEIECLKEDMEVLQGKKSTDMIQLRDLKTENKHLEETLLEVQQKKNELEFRLDKALCELKEKSDNQEKENLIENLRDKVKELTLEREQAKAQEAQLEKDYSELDSNFSVIKGMNFQLQEELEKLLSEYGHLAIEHEKLRKKCQKDKDKKTFKDFVTLKRELNSVKDENDNLKSRVKSNDFNVLKDDPVSVPAILPPVTQSVFKKYAPTGKKKMLAISLNSASSIGEK